MFFQADDLDISGIAANDKEDDFDDEAVEVEEATSEKAHPLEYQQNFAGNINDEDNLVPHDGGDHLYAVEVGGATAPGTAPADGADGGTEESEKEENNLGAELREVQMEESKGRGDGGTAPSSGPIKLQKDLSIIDKPYQVHEDLNNVNYYLIDNYVANHDEMLAQAAESYRNGVNAQGPGIGHFSSRKHTPIESREPDNEPVLSPEEQERQLQQLEMNLENLGKEYQSTNAAGTVLSPSSKQFGKTGSTVPPQMSVTHKDLEFTPVPLFECVFCVRDVQAQDLAFRKVGEDSLLKRWRKMNRKYLDFVFTQEEEDKWSKVYGKHEVAADEYQEDYASRIQDMLNRANKGACPNDYHKQVIMNKALLQLGAPSTYGSGFDELPAPVLSKQIASKKVRGIIDAHLKGRPLKIEEAREKAALQLATMQPSQSLMPFVQTNTESKHFKDLDKSFEGKVAPDNWAISRRQRILSQTSFSSGYHDIFNPVFTSDEELEAENHLASESLQVIDGMEGVWDSEDEKWWRGMFGGIHSNKRLQSSVNKDKLNQSSASPQSTASKIKEDIRLISASALQLQTALNKMQSPPKDAIQEQAAEKLTESAPQDGLNLHTTRHLSSKMDDEWRPVMVTTLYKRRGKSSKHSLSNRSKQLAITNAYQTQTHISIAPQGTESGTSIVERPAPTTKLRKPLQLQLEEEKEEYFPSHLRGALNKSNDSRREVENAGGVSSRCSSFLCLSPEDHTGRVTLNFQPTGGPVISHPSPFKQLPDKLVTEEDDFIDDGPATQMAPLRPLEIHSSRLPQPPRLMQQQKITIKPESINFRAQPTASSAMPASHIQPPTCKPYHPKLPYPIKSKLVEGANQKAEEMELNQYHSQFRNKEMLIFEPLDHKRKTVAIVTGDGSQGLQGSRDNPFMSPQSRQLPIKPAHKNQKASVGSIRKMKSEQKSFRIHSLKSARRQTGAPIDRSRPSDKNQATASDPTASAICPTGQNMAAPRRDTEALLQDAVVQETLILNQNSEDQTVQHTEQAQTSMKTYESTFDEQLQYNSSANMPQFIKFESIDLVSNNEKSSLDQYSGGMASSLLPDYQQQTLHQQSQNQVLSISSRLVVKKDQSIKAKITQLQMKKKRSAFGTTSHAETAMVHKASSSKQVSAFATQSHAGTTGGAPLHLAGRHSTTTGKLDSSHASTRKQVKTAAGVVDTRSRMGGGQSWRTQPSHYLNDSILRKRKAILKQREPHFASRDSETREKRPAEMNTTGEEDHHSSGQPEYEAHSYEQASSVANTTFPDKSRNDNLSGNGKFSLPLKEANDEQADDALIKKRCDPIFIQNNQAKFARSNFRPAIEKTRLADQYAKAGIRSARANLKQILQPNSMPSFIPQSQQQAAGDQSTKLEPAGNSKRAVDAATFTMQNAPQKGIHQSSTTIKSIKPSYPRKAIIPSSKKNSFLNNSKNQGDGSRGSNLVPIEDVSPCEKIECGGDDQSKPQKATIVDRRLQAIQEIRNQKSSLQGQNENQQSSGSTGVKTGLKKFLNKISFTHLKGSGDHVASINQSKSIFNSQKQREPAKSGGKGKVPGSQQILKRSVESSKEQQRYESYRSVANPLALNVPASRPREASQEPVIQNQPLSQAIVQNNKSLIQPHTSRAMADSVNTTQSVGKSVSNEHYVTAGLMEARKGLKTGNQRLVPPRKAGGPIYKQPDPRVNNAAPYHARGARKTMPAKKVEPVFSQGSLPQSQGQTDSVENQEMTDFSTPFQKAANSQSLQELNILDKQSSADVFCNLRQGSQCNSQNNLAINRAEMQMQSFNNSQRPQMEKLIPAQQRAKLSANMVREVPQIISNSFQSTVMNDKSMIIMPSRSRKKRSTQANTTNLTAKSARKGKSSSSIIQANPYDLGQRLSEGQKGMNVSAKGRLSNPNYSMIQRPSSKGVYTSNIFSIYQSRQVVKTNNQPEQKAISIQSGTQTLPNKGKQEPQHPSQQQNLTMSLEPKTPFEPQKRSIQLFNTEKKKKRKPVATTSYASASMVNEAMISNKTVVASPNELFSPRGASVNRKKSPSVSVQVAHESKSNSIASNNSYLNPGQLKQPTIIGGIERIKSSKLVNSVANLTVHEEPDAEEFISPDLPQKKTVFTESTVPRKSHRQRMIDMKKMCQLEITAQLFDDEQEGSPDGQR